MTKALNRLAEEIKTIIVSNKITVFETTRGENKTASIRISGGSIDPALKLFLNKNKDLIHFCENGKYTWIQNLILDCNFSNKYNPSKKIVKIHREVLNLCKN
jgi:hypothetical protein